MNDSPNPSPDIFKIEPPQKTNPIMRNPVLFACIGVVILSLIGIIVAMLITNGSSGSNKQSTKTTDGESTNSSSNIRITNAETAIEAVYTTIIQHYSTDFPTMTATLKSPSSNPQTTGPSYKLKNYNFYLTTHSAYTIDITNQIANPASADDTKAIDTVRDQIATLFEDNSIVKHEELFDRIEYARDQIVCTITKAKPTTLSVGCADTDSFATIANQLKAPVTAYQQIEKDKGALANSVFADFAKQAGDTAEFEVATLYMTNRQNANVNLVQLYRKNTSPDWQFLTKDALPINCQEYKTVNSRLAYANQKCQINGTNTTVANYYANLKK